MKALVWTAPEVMELQEAEKPAPQAGEVLLKVKAVGICGSEIEGYLGHNSLRVPPLIMGHEFCGVIEVCGEGVTGLSPGQKVVVNPLRYCGKCQACRRGTTQLCSFRSIVGIHRPGAFGEWVAVPAGQVVPVPDRLSDTRAALAEPLACSLRATRRAMREQPFANVVIFGAGGIGLLCAQVAKLLGAANVLIADTNGNRLQVALDTVADEVLNPKSSSLSAAVASLGERGVDVVIDAAGFQPTREASLEILNPGGTIMNIGLGIDRTELPINHLIRSEIQILGSFCYTDQDFMDAVQLLVEGRVTETGWTEIRDVEEGGQAFRDLVEGKVNLGKIFLRMERA